MWVAYFLGSDFWKDWGEQIRKEAKGLLMDEDGVEEEKENFDPIMFDDKTYDEYEEDVFGDEDYF